MNISFTGPLGKGSSGKSFGSRPSRGGDQVQKLIEDIAKVKKVGVAGGSVVYSFMSRPVQPLQKRIHPVF